MRRALVWVAALGCIGLVCTLGVVALMVGAGFQPPPGCSTSTTTPVGDTTGTPIEVTAKAALAAGFTGQSAVEAVAIAGAESEYDPTAENDGSTASGLWQIMLSFHEPKFRGADWRDPYANARVAYQIWRDRGSWADWVTWPHPASQRLGEARAAIDAVSGDATAVSAGGTVTGPGPDGVGPEAQVAADFIRQEWNFTGTIGGYGTRSGETFHDDGLAIDVMLDASDTYQGAVGDAIAEYFAGDGAAQFGVNNIIWDRQITNAGRGWEWGAYTGTSPHTDHVHIDFHPTGAAAVVPVAAGPGTAGCVTPTVTGGAVVWPVDPATDSENFGGAGALWANGHTGTDFSVACGTPVKAAHAGTVQITLDQGWSGPWLVKVSTGPESLTTWYAHMQQVDVTHGQQVDAGQVLGQVGSEGHSTGCHLHFEVHPRNGTIYEDDTDPSVWLANHVGQPTPGSVVPVAATGGGEVVASFNVLGSSHTLPGSGRRGFASGVQRIRKVPPLFESLGVTLAGLQEFQPDQRRAFTQTAPGWRVWYPADASGQNAIVYRTDRWTLVRGASVTIPYFGGTPTPQPVALLRHTSGVELWVMNVHNPADAHGPAQHLRDRAVAAELRMIDRTGGSWLLFGDMNDYDEFYCPAVSAGLQAANGGNVSPCTPPRPHTVDWVMGTADVGFSGYRRFDPPGRISDHPIVVTTIH